MKWKVRIIAPLVVFVLMLTSCSYNPLSGNNHTTGTTLGAISGAAVGGGGVALLGGSKPLIAAAALAGGAIGYYVTTQRYDSGGIIQGGGQVYNVGEYVGIDIPTDSLFEANSAELLPDAEPILDSAVDVLERNPNNNILVSGNTSGFGRSKWEVALAEKRAARVAAYLWNAGVNDFKEMDLKTRKLTYVGYGDYFPISSNLSNGGLRSNSRIQITSYPSTADLHLDGRHRVMHNIGSYSDDDSNPIRDPGRQVCCKN